MQFETKPEDYIKAGRSFVAAVIGRPVETSEYDDIISRLSDDILDLCD